MASRNHGFCGQTKSECYFFAFRLSFTCWGVFLEEKSSPRTPTGSSGKVRYLVSPKVAGESPEDKQYIQMYVSKAFLLTFSKIVFFLFPRGIVGKPTKKTGGSCVLSRFRSQERPRALPRTKTWGEHEEQTRRQSKKIRDDAETNASFERGVGSMPTVRAESALFPPLCF